MNQLKFKYLSNRGKKNFPAAFVSLIFVCMALSACTSINTFPMLARAGDTISVMVGGSEEARKETVNVTLQDINGQTWDLKSLGLVRSVFDLRADGRAYGLHYSSYVNSYIPWANRHEPLQTVLVTDLPQNIAAGTATLTISLNAADNSSGVTDPFSVKLEILPGSGAHDQFTRKDSGSGTLPVDFSQLEPAPHAKISFGSPGSGYKIGAAALVVSFDSTVLNGNDINVYAPESTVRGSLTSTDAFGKTQRMIYWRQDGQKIYLDLIAPQGINPIYLNMYIIHPKGILRPNFILTSANVYGIDGTAIAVQPTLEYFP